MIAESADTVSFFLFTFILYFLSVLSKRLGEVLGMRKHYYLYYSGMFFTLAGSIMTMGSSERSLLVGHVFFGLGLTFGLVASIKYWGWLIKEFLRS